MTPNELTTFVRDLGNWEGTAFVGDPEIQRHGAQAFIEIHNRLTIRGLFQTHLRQAEGTATAQALSVPADFQRYVPNSFQIGPSLTQLHAATDVSRGRLRAVLDDPHFEPTVESPVVSLVGTQFQLWQRTAGVYGSPAYRFQYAANASTPSAGTANYDLPDGLEPALVYMTTGRVFQKKEDDQNAALKVQIANKLVAEFEANFAQGLTL